MLLWDEHGDEKWNMCASEDSVKIGSNNVAALYAMQAAPLDGVPRSLLVRRRCLCINVAACIYSSTSPVAMEHYHLKLQSSVVPLYQSVHQCTAASTWWHRRA
jgi:hypothetical protein